jgi:UDP:flavonoid glycosyltransferase YjiC (YdhE family)
MRILLTPQGTHGDVRPLVALGLMLRRAGHEVVFGAPPNCHSWIEGLGFPFHSVGLDLESPRSGQNDAMGNPLRSALHGVRLIGELIEAQFADLPAAAKGAELIVGSGLELAGRSIAEQARIPYCFVCHSPTALVSRHHPPVMVPYRTLPTWVNRWLWRMNGIAAKWTMGRWIDVGRRGLGLPKLRDLARFVADGVILVADEPLAPLPPDCQILARTPYWSCRGPEALDADLRDFLGQGSRAVYIGFGSMPDPQPQVTLQLLLDLSSDVRLVVANERARSLFKGTSTRIHWIRSAPHHDLFPLVAAAIHHGGAGTTHTAARAGVPQIVVPHIADQYYWGHRVHQLGIGPAPLRRSHLSAGVLRSAIVETAAGTRQQRTAYEMGAVLRDIAERASERAVDAVVGAHAAHIA